MYYRIDGTRRVSIFVTNDQTKTFVFNVYDDTIAEGDENSFLRDVCELCKHRMYKSGILPVPDMINLSGDHELILKYFGDEWCFNSFEKFKFTMVSRWPEYFV